MLGTLAAKQGLADGVLDSVGDLKEIKLQKGAQTFLSKLELMIGPTVNLGSLPTGPAAAPLMPPKHLHGTQRICSVLSWLVARNAFQKARLTLFCWSWLSATHPCGGSDSGRPMKN